MLLNKTQKALVGVAIAQTPQDFSIIRDPDYAAVLCQRQMSSGALAWLASLDPACLPKARVILRPDRVPSALVQICDMSRMRFCVERDAFIAHAQQLSDAFMHVMKAPYLRLRFDVISHNALQPLSCRCNDRAAYMYLSRRRHPIWARKCCRGSRNGSHGSDASSNCSARQTLAS